MAKRIRVDEETHAALTSLKGDDETFDDLLTRLLRERHDGPQSEAGLWEGSDARETRRELNDGIDTQDSES